MCMLLNVLIAGSWVCHLWLSLWRYLSWAPLCLPGAGSLLNMFLTVFFLTQGDLYSPSDDFKQVFSILAEEFPRVVVQS